MPPFDPANPNGQPTISLETIAEGGRVLSARAVRDHFGATKQMIPGWVSDPMLEEVVKRHTLILIDALGSQVRQLAAAGSLDRLSIGTTTTLKLKESGTKPRFARGDIPERFFPFAFDVQGPKGERIPYDGQLNFTAENGEGIFEVRGFMLVGCELYVMPRSFESVNLSLATTNEVAAAVAPEATRQANLAILQEVADMIQSRAAEQTRQQALAATMNDTA